MAVTTEHPNNLEITDLSGRTWECFESGELYQVGCELHTVTANKNTNYKEFLYEECFICLYVP